jgi:predicted Rossmann-fold nucleotide-binding protein
VQAEHWTRWRACFAPFVPKIPNLMDEYLYLPHTPTRKGLRIIVCGGRDYGDKEAVCRALDTAHARKPIGVIVHGNATGADTLAKEWAESKGVPQEPHPASWKEFGKAAGPMRNRRMAGLGADGCIAFPGGPGTADMCQQAEEHGIPVWKPYR